MTAPQSPIPEANATANPVKPTTITLEDLAREMKMSPREARMMLRLAAKQAKLYPTMGKEHIARQPWQWTPESKGHNEARNALTASE